MRAALGILVAAALAYIAFCLLVFVQQRSLMYFPTPPTRTPPGAEVIALAGNVVVTAFRQDRAPALLYFGGNAEDVNGSLGELAAAFPGHAIYLMQYRGYGGSDGAPTEEGLVSDALALYDKVRRRHERIEVAGRSLGSGVAIQLAAARPVDRLVLITPFDSMRDVAGRHYPYLPVRWLLRDPYDSAAYAPKVNAPTVLVAAADDEIIPRASTEALFRCFAPGVATMTVIEGVGHNTISSSPRYIAAISGGAIDASLAEQGERR
ncbi:MAG TPA: alpha/beta hydrolase [Telluria sp.]|nr:alpha/beta hydrolase [Telluria sp.]